VISTCVDYRRTQCKNAMQCDANIRKSRPCTDGSVPKRLVPPRPFPVTLQSAAGISRGWRVTKSHASASAFASWRSGLIGAAFTADHRARGRK